MTAAATVALVGVAVWLATEITQSRRRRPLDMDTELHRIERGLRR